MVGVSNLVGVGVIIPSLNSSSSSSGQPGYEALYFNTSTPYTQATTVSEIETALNTAGFTIEEGKLYVFKIRVVRSTINGFSLVEETYKFKKNNTAGTWGTSSTNGAVSLVDFIYEDSLTIVENLTTDNIVYSLGNIGSQTIQFYLNNLDVNTLDFMNGDGWEVLLNNGTTYTFHCIINGFTHVYDFIGTVPKTVGLGNDTVFGSDFDLITFSGNAATSVSNTPELATGTNITFLKNRLYNSQTFLTSGNLILDLTGAVLGVNVLVYCYGYIPTITGTQYKTTSGALDEFSLNILSFYYDGTNVLLDILNVEILDAPTLSATPGDSETTFDWTSIPHAENYVLEIDDNAGFTSPTEIYSGSLLTYTATGLTNGVTYYGRVKAIASNNGLIESAWSNIASETPAQANPYENNLIAHYNLNANANDYTGLHNGTPTAITYVAAKVGNGASFNGTTSYIAASDADALSMTDGVNDQAFTVSFWVNFNTFAGIADIIGKGNVSTSSEWLIQKNGANLRFILYSQNSNGNYLRTTYSIAALSPGTWYMFTFTYDGSGTNAGMKTYINGSVVAASASNVGTYVKMSNTNGNLFIGTHNNVDSYLNGFLDEIGIWKRIFTPTEVNDKYILENAGTPIL